MKGANLPTFLKFGNANKSDICAIFAKKLWVATKLGGLEQNWGPVPSPGLKPPLDTLFLISVYNEVLPLILAFLFV